jgi:hypothetical protein
LLPPLQVYVFAPFTFITAPLPEHIVGVFIESVGPFETEIEIAALAEPHPFEILTV